MNTPKIIVTYGLIARAELDDLNGFVEQLEGLIAKYPGVSLVYQKTSASRLYIKEQGQEDTAVL